MLQQIIKEKKITRMNGPMKLTQADKILDNAKLESGFKLASNELFHTGKVFQARKKSENIQLASMRKVVVMSTAKPCPCSFAIVIPCQGKPLYFLFVEHDYPFFFFFEFNLEWFNVWLFCILVHSFSVTHSLKILMNSGQDPFSSTDNLFFFLG
jgi:hypothetical protein